jgi:hypothetical protein
MQAIAERHARPNAKRFDRPYRLRDDRVLLHHFPVRRGGYWASTFTESLPPSPCRSWNRRGQPQSYGGQAGDKSSVYNPKLLKLALIGLRRFPNHQSPITVLTFPALPALPAFPPLPSLGKLFGDLFADG